MPKVTGQLTDFGLDPMQDSNPRITFTFMVDGHRSSAVAATSVLANRATEAVPARNGYFEADLTSTEKIAPAGYYLVTVHWRDKLRIHRHETLPWQLRVPAAGGVLADLLRVPSNPALVWTGEAPPLNPSPGSWWQQPSSGDLREYSGTGWNLKANTRGPAGYNAIGAEASDQSIAALLQQTAGPTKAAAALQTVTAPGYTIAPGATSGTRTQAAITALIGSFGLGGGEIILGAGVHTWDSIPRIPHSLTAGLSIRGEQGALIRLTNTGRRAFDLGWTEADQTFRNFTITDLQIDAAASTGRNHIIVGNYVNGSFVGRFNVDNMRIERIKTFGAKADPTTTNHPTHVHLTPQHNSSGEAENTLTNIYLADLDLNGGNTGVIIGGNGPNSGIEVYSDNVVIERSHFTGGTLPTKFFTTSGFHIGGKGHCGRVVMRDLVSENSGDNGFEVNAARDALLDNCLSIDAANVGFYARNFHPLLDVGHSRIEWRHCRAWIRDLTPSVAGDMRGRGFMIGGDKAFGRLLYTGGSEHQVDRPGDLSEVSSLMIGSCGATEIVLEAFKSRINNISIAPATTYFPTPISLVPGTPCNIRGSFTVEARGKRTGGSETYFRSCAIGGPDTTVDLAGTFDVALDGFAVHTAYGYDVGELAGSKVSGRLRAHVAGGTIGRGVRVRPALTVNRRLTVSGDFSGMAEGGQEIQGADAAQAANINMTEVTFKKAPGAPTRAATGSPFVYRNISMFPELVNVRIDGRTPGSAAITGINYAKAGGSEIGTGATSGQFYLQNGDSLTVAYGPGEYPPVIRTQCALPSA